ncbi:ABC transporter ATP-binding protein [Burkholderia perseverans]|uniref:ABC transporter ATP-binding protein n=1 Tax=Burkholderia perseverans TaxID=2615214 RepID=UPI001FEDADB1|nr:ABC transporter ATP-binding protein [Burkholderia perseverans]
MSDVRIEAKRPAAWRAAYRRLLEAAGDHAGALNRSLIGLAVAAFTQGLGFACLFPLFEAVAGRRPAATVFGWLAALGALTLVTAMLRWRAQGFEFNGRLARATHALRVKLGERLRRMPLETLQDSRSGELNALLLGSVDENLNYTIALANLILVASVTPCVVALAALLIDWRIGLMLLIMFPLIGLSYRWRRPALARGARTLADADRRLDADVVEFMQGLPALRAARVDLARASRLDEGFRRVHDVQLAALRREASPGLAIASLVELGLQLVVAAGLTWVVNGTLELAVVAAVMVTVARFSEPMATLVSYAKLLELIAAALARIAALSAIEPLPLRGAPRVPTRFDLAFEGVGFRYARGQADALADFDMALPMHGMTALVGPSGSGKSTVMRLLLRHADPQRGAIRIGGVDLREIPEAARNALISVVFQDVYLFDDTVLANIRMARPDASDADVLAVARAARCEDFVARLPQGWQTRLGEIGGRLSGGERQRISIARALLKDAPIVCLDEPTSALDVESELAVQQAIDVLVRDRTVIVITHRLSTIVGADRILVIDGGRLVQQGRHEELLRTEGRYRAMWMAQRHASAYPSRLGAGAV